MSKKKKKSRSRHTAKADTSHRSPVRWVLPGIVIAIVIAGLSAGLFIGLRGSDESEAAGYHGPYPGFVTSSTTPNAKKGYKLAVDYMTQLDMIPCFCGCGQHSGHKSVRNCFIKPGSPQGANVQFDQHGAGCKMCVDIVLEAADRLQNGDSLKDVRALIEDEWKDDLDTMTPTPPVEA